MEVIVGTETDYSEERRRHRLSGNEYVLTRWKFNGENDVQ